MKNKMVWLFIALYCIIGTIGAIFFQRGGVYPEYFWLFFVVGNIFGWTSTWMLMLVYARTSSVSIANMICVAMSTIVGQTAMWLLFRSPFNWQMLVGIAVMISGMVIGVSAPDKKQSAKECEQ